ncbi:MULTISPECIES: hypothetical protein [unclassified Microbacterium]|uniref:hypothetical protein n=1 Tax=unclassified Microbacterium TaxID=2609290 RepID=UPI000EA8C421|nr:MULTISPECIES: hypothetical protein [unclassified Microbacterium]MBT2483690.1 hypothetical protein [Microbacterium sp. ISL-108]RKN66689.1 hypothetical protein D7252_03155 [Microbacterium sp. CGR2]
MPHPRPLPPHLGSLFSVREAQKAGIDAGRLRRADLRTPFRGVRATSTTADDDVLDPFERQRVERRIRAYEYGPRLRSHQFLSHESAVALWGGPMPLTLIGGRPADGRALPVHVSTLGDGPLVRVVGVQAHRQRAASTRLVGAPGLVVASPEDTFAALGRWELIHLVALGDFFCRAWRTGHGRPDAGKSPHSTVARLRAAIDDHRRTGANRLRQALELIREDSWSPRESELRCRIVGAGLPEPELNRDIYDADGRFLGCFDLTYPRHKVAIEYHGMLHAGRYAEDVERIAALRAAGWTVIEVTSALFARPDELIARIRHALAAG